MTNPYQVMRNIYENLFEGEEEESADALAEYDPEAAELVREAARSLYAARSTGNAADFAQADTLTHEAAALLLLGGGSSVYVRFPVMVTARLVELEASLLAARGQSAAPKESGA
ncbi:hypothetical protein [Streptomyces sp. NPDC093111]|uniref:hypothetical protein n=1 Tax=Streptomyces sp. NPDC093111 TaxID=3154978 RepID=UPI0034250B4B